MVKSEKATTVTLRGKPKTEEKFYDLPLNIKESSSVEIKKYPRIEPNLSVGLTVSYSDTVELSPTVQVPFLHITDAVDILTPKITFNENVSIGLDLVNYNLGEILPVITDTWIGIGPSISLGKRYVELTLTSKF